MLIKDKVVLVTGSAAGIGAELALAMAARGARALALADLDLAGAQVVASRVEKMGARAIAVQADVSVEADVRRVIDLAVGQFGCVDICCSNAGVATSGGPEASDNAWNATWAINVMSQVYAARHLLPAMLERGSGYFLNTCSAAGLLTSPGAAPYAVTKHGAVAFAEWLSITYGGKGIGVSALCPQAVRTPMLEKSISGGNKGSATLSASVIEPELVARYAVDGVESDTFLILPHPEVADYVLRKATNLQRWIEGMRRVFAKG
ncbi:MAG: SDR family NAD(P)-dependent oxidoreductase [Alphaproteobacteria bacterium]|nr:SDR family NAD(P)-dependent oxidoreductase [Alphaproteobacteria bacterium]